jgi:hypothetical protein
LLVSLVSRVKDWKDALLIVKPDTLLRWHRQGVSLTFLANMFQVWRDGFDRAFAHATITLMRMLGTVVDDQEANSTLC